MARYSRLTWWTIADAGRHNLKGLKSLLAPFKKLVAFAIAGEFENEVLLQRGGDTGDIDLHGVVDDQINRHQRFNQLGISSQLCDRVAHGGQIDEKWDAGEVLEDDACNDEGNFLLCRMLGIPIGESADVILADPLAVKVTQDGFQDNADADGQFRDGTDARLLQSWQGIICYFLTRLRGSGPKRVEEGMKRHRTLICNMSRKGILSKPLPLTLKG